MNEKQPPQDRRDWERICLDYLDSASETVDPAFRQLLNEPDFCRLLAAHAVDHVELQAALSFVPSSYEEELRQLLDERQRGSTQGGEDAGVAEPQQSRPGSQVAGAAWRRSAMYAAAALAAAVLLGLSVRYLTFPAADDKVAVRSGLASSEPVVEAVSWSGQVKVDGRAVDWDAAEDLWIRSGSEVATEGGSGTVNLRFVDGSMIEVASDSIITVELRDGQKVIDVQTGFISASVEPQPAGKPMAIITAEATVEVVGTELAISRLPKATTLSVTGGRVRMRRNADGQLVEVRSGEYAVAADKTHEAYSENYRAYELADCPDEWTEGFEDGLPAEWRSGEWVSSDLPEGSQGAVRASQLAEGDDVCVCTHVNEEIWKRGLVEVHDDSVLNIRMKLDDDEFYHVLLFMRGHMHYEYQEPRLDRSAWTGKWRTLSIPLSHFKQTGREYVEGDDFQGRATPSPPHDRPIYMLMVSSQKRDIGITIDRIWVSRDHSVGKPISTAEDSAGT